MTRAANVRNGWKADYLAQSCLVVHWITVTRFSLGAVVSAFLGVFSCTPEPKGSPLVVEAAADGNSCHITVDHQQVTSQQLLQIASAGKHRWGLIRMKRDLPYKCVGAVIITLQEAGFSTVRTEELDQR